MGDRGTLHKLLDQRAERFAEVSPYRYLESGEVREGRPWAGLRHDARRLATALTEQGATGRRVALACPDPETYILAFFACLYAGAVAVSARAPEPPQLGLSLDRLTGVLESTGASFVLAPTFVHERCRERGWEPPGDVGWLLADEPAADGKQPLPGDAARDSCEVAYVQHTSGSTGGAKGIELTHGNFLANLASQAEVFDMDAETVIVSWMPLFHDFGFVAPILQPLLLGSRTVFLSPRSFLLRPAGWLLAISEFGATVSGAPAFAYDLVMARTTFDDLAHMDLSRWRHAIIGSEPIRPQTVRLFTEVFRPAGLRPDALTPCFGLAESTCLLTADRSADRPLVRGFDRGELARDRAVPSDAQTAVELVACGTVVPRHELTIADPRTGAALPDGHVGEIVGRGPSTAPRYCDEPEASAVTFPDPGTVHTGDLGFVADGRLYVTGRLKEIVIVRGEKHLPHEIEQTVRASDPLLEGLAGAAFAVSGHEGERLVVVHEAGPHGDDERQLIVDAIRAAVTARHGIAPDDVLLVAPGEVPRTQSGKIMRTLCRERYLGRSGGAANAQQVPDHLGRVDRL